MGRAVIKTEFTLEFTGDGHVAIGMIGGNTVQIPIGIAFEMADTIIERVANEMVGESGDESKSEAGAGLEALFCHNGTIH